MADYCDRGVNTTFHMSNGPSLIRSPSLRPDSTLLSPDGTAVNHHQLGTYHRAVTLVIIKDEYGYGMKVTGDNPVYVQSVKDGGAAEKAGVNPGDTIIKVNGTDVTHSKHTDVVELIKSCVEVELTVQKRITHGSRSPVLVVTTVPATPSTTVANCISTMPTTAVTTTSSSVIQRPLHHHNSAPARDRVTAPQPVDHEKLRQLECQRVQTFRLMLEKEQRYVEALKNELVKCTDSSNEQQTKRDLLGAERRVRTLQEKLTAVSCQSSGNTNSNTPSPDLQLFSTPPPPPPPPPLCTLPTRNSHSAGCHATNSFLHSNHSHSLNNTHADSLPPPLPSRNRTLTSPVLGSNTPIPLSPPPLPPRQYLHSPTFSTVDRFQDSANTTVSSNSPSSPVAIHHQRTKSSPDQINANTPMSLPPEAILSKRLVASESLSDLQSVKRSKGGLSWDVNSSPSQCPIPGTQPPPYTCTTARQIDTLSPLPFSVSMSSQDETDEAYRRSPSSPTENLPNSPGKGNIIMQHPIISMEDDDISDQEMSNLEDHGPFKNFTRLLERNAHLAVFLNYVMSISDPSSLLFYLVTNLYKEGNAKEMKKWSYEIHSSFLVPGAPLRLNNVDENMAKEIDGTLTNDADKEEELRKIFQKARKKAREEINEQLTDFQQKRTAGLGTLFGPPDVQLDESMHDKSKEMKIVEQYLVPKMEPFIDDIEKEVVDDRSFATAAAFGTILSKTFGIRGTHFTSLLERCPTFVSKEKSFKARLIGRSRKVTVRGHHFVAHQYFIITYCNHCQLIIWGIGPQGYQCTNCFLNIHRHCVKVLEENCPGPLQKKDKPNDRISKFMDRIRPEREARKKSGFNFPPVDKLKKQLLDDKEECLTDNEIGDKSGSNTKNKVDSVKEIEERLNCTAPDSQYNSESENNFLTNVAPNHLVNKNKSTGASINRSESYKERIPQKRHRERRKTSDPNLSKTNSNDVEVDTTSNPFYATANSGSSSNSNLSLRSLDSPSNSLEAVSNNSRNSCENTATSNSSTSNNITILTNNICSSNRTSAWDSDTEAEPDPPDWTKTVSEEVLKQLTPAEKKRQEVINELFHTERSHVRALKVLDQLFYQPMKELQVLPLEHIQLLFPNLEEMLEIHSHFNNNMKARKKENPVVGVVGDILLKMFDGNEGEIFQQAAAVFCSKQQIALAALKEKRRKDPKLNSFLSDAEGNPICRRLQLKDIIPTGMLRLTKYPLLFENLVKYTHCNFEEERRHIQRSLERSKEILNHVNAAVKEAEDQHRLAEIQKRLDKSLFDKLDLPVSNEFKNLDLTKHRLIHEGCLNWRITNRQKMIELHVLLLEDVIILLQKQDEKYLLKFYNTNSSAGERTPILSPVIKVSTVLVRTNATDKKSLYLVNTSHNGAQIYDLVASSSAEKKTWFRHISEAAEAYKTKDGKHRGRTADPSQISSHDFDCAESPQQHLKSKHGEDTGPHDDSHNVSCNSLNSSAEATDSPAKTLGIGGKSPGKQRKHIVEPPRLTTEGDPLIEPSQVLISQRSVLTAEPVLTPLERLRRKDELIKEALKEKQQLVADILHVPRDDYETIADIAGEPAFDKEASELVLAAVNQANQLTSVINECLQVTEEEAILVTSEVHQQSSQSKVSRLPAVPVPKLQNIANTISSHLTQLLNIMTQRDEERERLRQELQRSREQLHTMHEIQQRIGMQSDITTTITTDNSCSTDNKHELPSVIRKSISDGSDNQQTSEQSSVKNENKNHHTNT